MCVRDTLWHYCIIGYIMKLYRCGQFHLPILHTGIVLFLRIVAGIASFVSETALSI